MTIRYAKRSVQIDGRVFNPGDIIPEFITDEAAASVHAFDELSTTLEKNLETVEDNEKIEVSDDEEDTIIVEGAELLSSDVAPSEDVTPATPKKGRGNK